MSNGNIQSDKSTNGHLVFPGMAASSHQPAIVHSSELDRRTLPWFSEAGWGVFLCVAYPLLAVAPLVALYVIDPDADHPLVAQLGINCAMIGFTLLSMQFVLTARLSWIEAPFGLDLVLRFHRAMAFVIVALLCAQRIGTHTGGQKMHPALIRFPATHRTPEITVSMIAVLPTWRRVAPAEGP